MRRMTVLAAGIVCAMASSALPATAVGADAFRWGDSYDYVNSWTNPCTGDDVVLLSKVDVGGTVVINPTGEVQTYGYANLISGEEYERIGPDVAGDPTGWVVVHLRGNNPAGGIANPDTGAAHWMWQLHLTVENPETGQRYTALFNPKVVMTANGDVVVDPGSWVTVPHNTCLGVGS